MAQQWTRLECEAIVADYLAMLYAECRGETYSKADHRRKLKQQLQNRSDGSVEYKHQNISAILLKADHVYIRGYKPAWNYQSLLEAVVISRLDQVDKEIQTVEETLSMRLPEKPPMPDLHSLFVNPPEMKIKHGIREQRAFKTKHINYAEKEARNHALGRHGEEFVLAVEKARLASLGRTDLARDIEWTSKEKGDGAGYDIRSFEGKTDEELFIEVKTTNSGMYQPFLITRNELLFSEANVERYALYRLFDFADTPAVFSLKGRITDHVQLEPRVYSAGFYE
jgi:Protein NO VEIN, C-terminal